MAQVIRKGDELIKSYKKYRNLGFLGATISVISFLCFALMMFTFKFSVSGFLMVGFGGGALFGGAMFNKATVYKTGIAGEEAAARLVSRLPDSYCAFQNLKISFEGNESELDLVVVGPTGIFVIENKHMNGYIMGQAEAHQWVQNKVGQGGTPYSKQFHSPIKQVGTHVYRLANVLRQNRINTYVEAAVYFSNIETVVQITGESKTPVFAARADGGNGVLSYITNRPAIMNYDLIMRTINLLNGMN